MVVKLKEPAGLKREMNVTFRAFNDGVSFRYDFPEQPNLKDVKIENEETQFKLAGDFSAWYTRADYDTYELPFMNTPVSQLKTANTPVTMKGDGFYISVHEAALIDYAGMTLKAVDGKDNCLRSWLVPGPDTTIRVVAQTPFKTPWRTIQIAPEAAKLVESNMILNLNDPNVLENTSWIKPMTYVGIWWGMHLDKYTWPAGPKHGATTENAKMYIDFASKHGIPGMLVEGWNLGWEEWKNFNFTQPYPDFDIEEVVRYGKEKGVALIGHHETGADVTNYENQMDDAFAYYHNLGMHAVKTGYVGTIHPLGEHHHGQWMVNHYMRAVKTAAKYQITIDVHEPIKFTGIERTYPNLLSGEGARGQEWNAWSEGNPPSHLVTLPYTRFLGGPMDYTPAIFDVLFDKYKDKERVHNTVANQIAIFVAFFSPVQMAADLPENYEGKPEFAFIEHCPTTWDETVGINGEVGDYFTVARRNGNSWYVGSITDENARTQDVPFSFLEKGKKYAATVYCDGKDADYETNPYPVEIKKYIVDSGTVWKAKLARGGGQAIEIHPATDEDLKNVAEYK
jgi:alpha-glucosidase